MFTHQIDRDLCLKIAELRDAEKLFALTDQSRTYLKEWLPWVNYTTSVEDTADFIQIGLQKFADNKGLNTVILYKGETVGAASFNEINWSNKTTSIGYWLGENYQGKGIMTKVSKALTTYAFTELKLNKVEIRAAVDNKKSRRIPERLGYVNEGCIRQSERLGNRYVDHVVYGVLAAEWKY